MVQVAISFYSGLILRQGKRCQFSLPASIHGKGTVGLKHPLWPPSKPWLSNAAPSSAEVSLRGISNLISVKVRGVCSIPRITITGLRYLLGTASASTFTIPKSYISGGLMSENPPAGFSLKPRLWRNSHVAMPCSLFMPKAFVHTVEQPWWPAHGSGFGRVFGGHCTRNDTEPDTKGFGPTSECSFITLIHHPHGRLTMKIRI